MSRSSAEGARELRKGLRSARQDRRLRCQRVELYERFEDVPAGIAERLSEQSVGPYQALMFAVAWRGQMFACVPLSDQLVRSADTEPVLRVLVQDLGAELDEA
jgi:hypothetical protein